jgi:hypothetical protein
MAIVDGLQELISVNAVHGSHHHRKWIFLSLVERQGIFLILIDRGDGKETIGRTRAGETHQKRMINSLTSSIRKSHNPNGGKGVRNAGALRAFGISPCLLEKAK